MAQPEGLGERVVAGAQLAVLGLAQRGLGVEQVDDPLQALTEALLGDPERLAGRGQ